MRTNGFAIVALFVLASIAASPGHPNGPLYPHGLSTHAYARNAQRAAGPFYRAPYSFGGIAFDPIPGVPAPIPSGQQPTYPLWADGEWPGATYPPCTNDATAAPEIFADDPETWNPKNWANGSSAVRIEEGVLGPPISKGLIFLYFLNTLGKAAHLNVAASGPAGATFLYYAPAVVVSPAQPPTLAGAHASARFLQAYTSGSTAGFTKVVTQPSPTRFATYSVPNGDYLAGELYVVGVANATTVYIYADDRATPAPFNMSYPIGDDGEDRRGFFRGAHFTIEHGISDIVEDNGGGESFWDIGRVEPSPTATPYPNSVDICQTPLPGRDAIKGISTTLTANFGVPIEIDGKPYPVGEYWFLDPRGNDPHYGFATAVYVANMQDPHTLATVSPGVYVVPTTYPGAASPQPSTVPSPLGASIALGFDTANAQRKIIWVQSAANGDPVRFWYLVPRF
jgi:hypothetical protein